MNEEYLNLVEDLKEMVDIGIANNENVVSIHLFGIKHGSCIRKIIYQLKNY